ncbi:MAG TPA: helix-turn-helix domain-containing protein [Bryobacteraceae bacterium]|jgi:DNA-binding transcriptional MerR regulator
MPRELNIGGLSKETGVKVVTIRFYEKIGVLAVPSRSAGNYRIYGQQHVRRLHFVRRCRELGFSLDQIVDFLRLSSEDSSSCSKVCRIAERHLKDVEAKLADLKRLATELRRINLSCNGTRPMSECRIIEALSARR